MNRRSQLDLFQAEPQLDLLDRLFTRPVVVRYRTPGTALEWSNLNEWMDGADELRRRGISRCSTKTYAQQDVHWDALEPHALVWIRAADAATCTRLLGMVAVTGNLPWERMHRGWRGGTMWEWVHVEVKNRLWRLEREADRESMGLGHNARAFA
jgi:hypothetical protein